MMIGIKSRERTTMDGNGLGKGGSEILLARLREKKVLMSERLRTL